MGLVIRCWWLPPSHLPIEQRMMEALGVIRQPELASIFGAGWFKGGRTKKAALSRPVNLENITPKAPPWRRVSMTDVPPHNDIYYQLGLWNGLDSPCLVLLFHYALRTCTRSQAAPDPRIGDRHHHNIWSRVGVARVNP